jgi:NAD(P)-dependent dehydrogenase (short-subunit alcohol dehydrogenase family)
MRFQQKVAVVTGAGSRMGAAAALLLASEGAAVVVADLNTDGGEAVQQAITDAGGTAVLQPTDVSDRESVHAMVARAVGELGKLDLAANVAGVAQRPTALHETTVELWDKTHAVNGRGLFFCLQAEIPRSSTPAGERSSTSLRSRDTGLPADDRLRKQQVRGGLDDPHRFRRVRAAKRCGSTASRPGRSTPPC